MRPVKTVAVVGLAAAVIMYTNAKFGGEVSTSIAPTRPSLSVGSETPHKYDGDGALLPQEQARDAIAGKGIGRVPHEIVNSGADKQNEGALSGQLAPGMELGAPDTGATGMEIEMPAPDAPGMKLVIPTDGELGMEVTMPEIPELGMDVIDAPAEEPGMQVITPGVAD